MKAQDVQQEQKIPAALALPLDVELMKQIAYEQREGLALLAKTDGPIPQERDLTAKEA